MMYVFVIGRCSVQSKIALIFAVAVATAMFSLQIQAMPLPALKQLYQNKEIIRVAEGCGRGWHWSYALRRCVR
jgi:hypothetical protein